MTFTLAGFAEGGGLRKFVFRCTRADRSHSTVMVRADVSLARKHEIRLQELPLICVRLLESLGEGELVGPITLTEDHMIGIQKAARAAAEKRTWKPAPRRPANANPNVGTGWRAARQ